MTALALASAAPSARPESKDRVADPASQARVDAPESPVRPDFAQAMAAQHRPATAQPAGRRAADAEAAEARGDGASDEDSGLNGSHTEPAPALGPTAPPAEFPPPSVAPSPDWWRLALGVAQGPGAAGAFVQTASASDAGASAASEDAGGTGAARQAGPAGMPGALDAVGALGVRRFSLPATPHTPAAAQDLTLRVASQGPDTKTAPLPTGRSAPLAAGASLALDALAASAPSGLPVSTAVAEALPSAGGATSSAPAWVMAPGSQVTPSLGLAAAARPAAPDLLLNLPEATPNAWQQPLLQALGDRLQLQLAARSEHAVIRLFPDQLGQVDIAIRHQGGGLQVQLSASHAEVQQQLQGLSEGLRHELLQRHSGEVSVQVAASAAPAALARDGESRASWSGASGPGADDASGSPDAPEARHGRGAQGQSPGQSQSQSQGQSPHGDRSDAWRSDLPARRPGRALNGDGAQRFRVA